MARRRHGAPAAASCGGCWRPRAARLPTTSEQSVSGRYKLRRFLRAADLPPAVAHFTWNGTWLPDEARGCSDAGRAATSGRAGCPDVDGRAACACRVVPRSRRCRRPDVTDYLPNDILAKADRMSMAHGLELRSPFLDPDLAEFALRLPAALKAGRTGATKRVLRELATPRVRRRRRRAHRSRASAFRCTPGCAGRRGRSSTICCRGEALAPLQCARPDRRRQRRGRRSHVGAPLVRLRAVGACGAVALASAEHSASGRRCPRRLVRTRRRRWPRATVSMTTMRSRRPIDSRAQGAEPRPSHRSFRRADGRLRSRPARRHAAHRGSSEPTG